MKRSKLSVLAFLLMILLFVYILKVHFEIKAHLHIDFENFNNETGSKNLIVPNYIHYVQFDKSNISFVTLVCMLSAYYNHGPSKIYLHTNIVPEGRYYEILKSILGDKLKFKDLDKPTHVFGQKLSSVQHSADVAKIKLVMKYGGIFLDGDVFVVQNLNRYRHFEFAIGWPHNQNIGTQVIIAHREARFPSLWLAQYQNYRPTMWYYNAGEAPTQNILKKKQHLVHRVYREFGVENLAKQLYNRKWNGWVNRYTIHMLDNHKEYLTNTHELNEVNYLDCNCTFSVLAQNILNNLLDDGVDIVKDSTLLVDSDMFSKQVLDFISGSSSSLLHKYLSTDLYYRISRLKSSTLDTKLKDLIMSGVKNPDSLLGIYVPDVESYTVYKDILDPIIRDYHGLKGKLMHPASNWGKDGDIGSFHNDRDEGKVISTRIRIARSVKGFPLNSKMTRNDYIKLEKYAKEAFHYFTEDLAGSYYSLEEMSKDKHNELVTEHFMFGECDRYLKDGGACQHWPTGRGIYLNKNKNFLVWVGEEDHLRIISMQKGGNLGEVFSRLSRAMKILDTKMDFVFTQTYGYLTFCPSNLGTTLRASVHIQLPRLSQSGRLKEVANKKGLQVRGTGGEHTGADNGIVDLSNIKRMGLTEIMAVKIMYDGVMSIIKTEDLLEN